MLGAICKVLMRYEYVIIYVKNRIVHDVAPKEIERHSQISLHRRNKLVRRNSEVAESPPLHKTCDSSL